MIDSQLKKPFELMGDSHQIFVSSEQKEIVASVLTEAHIPHYCDFLMRETSAPYTVKIWVFAFASLKDTRRAVAALNAAPESEL